MVPHYGFDMHFSEITVRWMALERTVRVTKAEMGGSTEREKGIRGGNEEVSCLENWPRDRAW